MIWQFKSESRFLENRYARASFTKASPLGVSRPLHSNIMLYYGAMRKERVRSTFFFFLSYPSVSASVRVRPRSLAAVMLDGERASQPCKHAKSGRGRPRPPARLREWRGRSITQRMSLVTLAPQKLMNERREGRSLLAAQIPLGASLLLFLSSSLMQQKALALSW